MKKVKNNDYLITLYGIKCSDDKYDDEHENNNSITKAAEIDRYKNIIENEANRYENKINALVNNYANNAKNRYIANKTNATLEKAFSELKSMFGTKRNEAVIRAAIYAYETGMNPLAKVNLNTQKIKKAPLDSILSEICTEMINKYGHYDLKQLANYVMEELELKGGKNK